MNPKRYNAGADIVKIFACFGVVLLHFGQGVRFASVSVPLFMFVSAYLCGLLFSSGTWSGLASRLMRLYLPFIAWGLIYFAIYTLLNGKCNCRALILQMAIGVPVCPVLYFIFLLASYSIILFVVGHAQHRLIILLVIVCVCLFIQYSGLNAMIFGELPFEIKMVFGRFVELLPAAVLGYTFFLREEHIQQRKGIAIVLLACVAIYISYLAFNLQLGCKGFSYQGVPLLLGTVGIGGLLIGMNVKAGKWCRQVASLSAGIYYIHLLVGKMLEVVIGRQRGWLEASAVYSLAAVGVILMKHIHGIKELVK